MSPVQLRQQPADLLCEDRIAREAKMRLLPLQHFRGLLYLDIYRK